jgi:hypothetical protein
MLNSSRGACSKESGALNGRDCPNRMCLSGEGSQVGDPGRLRNKIWSGGWTRGMALFGPEGRRLGQVVVVHLEVGTMSWCLGGTSTEFGGGGPRNTTAVVKSLTTKQTSSWWGRFHVGCHVNMSSGAGTRIWSRGQAIITCT